MVEDLLDRDVAVEVTILSGPPQARQVSGSAW
jgi:hypothetical protein